MAWVLLYNTLELLKWLIVIRAIMSWFVPVHSANPIVNFIRRVTDWVIQPISQMVPRTGGVDLSPIVAFFAIILLQQVVIRLA
jgi:YggT family protein